MRNISVCFYGWCGGHGAFVLSGAPLLPQVRFAGVCPSYAGEALDTPIALARQAGLDLRAYPSLPDLLRTERPDVLVVDPPFGLHLDGIRAGLEAGCAVYCDKPLVTEPEQVDTLLELVERYHRPVWAMQTMRGDAPFYTARRLVAAGAVGDVRLVQAQKSYRLGKRPDFYRDPSLYGGTLGWVGIHGIDLALWVTGKHCVEAYARQSAAASPYEAVETSTAVLLTLEGGALASITADYLRPDAAPTHGDDRLRVVGTRGVCEVLRDEVTLIDRDGERVCPLETPPHLFAAFIQALDGEPALLSTEESLAATRVAMAAKRAALSGVPVWL